MKKIISILLLAAFILSTFIACSPSNPPAVPDESKIPESGNLGAPETEPEPEIEKPESPTKTLLQKSNESYNGGKLGCTGLVLLAEYNRGVDFDINSYKDSTNKIYYIFLPCRADMSSVTFTATHKDGSESGPYTADFSDNTVSENEKVIGGINEYAIIVMQSNLPSVMLEIDESYGTIAKMNGDSSHETYAYGTMVATATNEMASENGWATRYESVDENTESYCSMKIRGRGNATWGYSKKPYHMVLENSVDLFGMGSAKKYVFLANYKDSVGFRTQLAFDLGSAMGIAYTSEHRQVDLFMNGEYLGMYTLAEKTEVGVNRVEIDQSKDILFEKDNYAAKEETYGFQTEHVNAKERGFRIISPEDVYTVNQCKNRLITAEEALYGNNDKVFEKYFDLESWAKMYLLQLYTMNSDAYYGSLYFYYDATDGKMYACSPWDFDWSLGVSWGSGANYTDPMLYDIGNIEWIKQMLSHKNFVETVLDVYYNGGVKEIIEGMPELVSKYGDTNRASALMNDIVTSVHYFPSDITDYDGSVAYVKEVCEKRVEYIANKMDAYSVIYGYNN